MIIIIYKAPTKTGPGHLFQHNKRECLQCSHVKIKVSPRATITEITSLQNTQSTNSSIETRIKYKIAHN